MGQKQENILNFYEQKKQSVLNAFYNSAIVNASNNKVLTATELDLNKEQQLSILAPKIARIQSEFLYPLLKRKYQIMKDLCLLPSINGFVPSVNDLNIDFKGLWSKYQKISDIKNINSALNSLSLVKGISENALEELDFNSLTRTITQTYGISNTKS